MSAAARLCRTKEASSAVHTELFGVSKGWVLMGKPRLERRLPTPILSVEAINKIVHFIFTNQPPAPLTVLQADGLDRLYFACSG
jgi:hypothetical protein